MSFNYLNLSVQSCPICGGMSFSTLKKNDRYFMGIVTVGCNNCGLIQTNPRPDQAGLDNFYKNDYRKYYQGVTTPNSKYIQEYNKGVRLADTVVFLQGFIKFQDESLSLLDIGCSEGALFSALRGANYKGQLFGVELNESFGKYAATNNNAEVHSSLNMHDTKFDLVILNHVFEHILQPDSQLKDIQKILSEKGLLYIDIPDAESYSKLDDLHLAHLFHFTSNTISRLLKNTGYQIIHIERYSPKFHPKSIRLIAKLNDLALPTEFITNPNTERNTWDRTSRISIVNKRIKNVAIKVPFLFVITKWFRSQLQKSKNNV